MNRGGFVLNRKLVAFFVLAVVFIALGIFMSFFHAPMCEDIVCFFDSMENCDRARYINEEREATWRYEVLDAEKNFCQIEVTLLQPKAGELAIEKFAGHSMICDYPSGISTYPERDLERCHGRLKEDMQEIVIRRLHTYVIENLGEVEESLELFRNPTG